MPLAKKSNAAFENELSSFHESAFYGKCMTLSAPKCRSSLQMDFWLLLLEIHMMDAVTVGPVWTRVSGYCEAGSSCQLSKLTSVKLPGNNVTILPLSKVAEWQRGQ